MEYQVVDDRHGASAGVFNFSTHHTTMTTALKVGRIMTIEPVNTKHIAWT